MARIGLCNKHHDELQHVNKGVYGLEEVLSGCARCTRHTCDVRGRQTGLAPPEPECPLENTDYQA
jgi:hypothetical protein